MVIYKGEYPRRARDSFYSPCLVWYSGSMSGSQKKNPLRPSYEEGELRDKTLEAKQIPDFTPEDLRRLVTKAVKKAPEGAKT